MITQGSLVVAKHNNKYFLGKVTAISHINGRCIVIPKNPKELDHNSILTFVKDVKLATADKYPEYFL